MRHVEKGATQCHYCNTNSKCYKIRNNALIMDSYRVFVDFNPAQSMRSCRS